MKEQLLNTQLKYFLYVRKSTDVEDKQVLSVAAQLVELKEFAKRMELHIADIIIETNSQKAWPPKV